MDTRTIKAAGHPPACPHEGDPGDGKKHAGGRVVTTGIEPVTFRASTGRSYHLSYVTVVQVQDDGQSCFPGKGTLSGRRGAPGSRLRGFVLLSSYQAQLGTRRDTRTRTLTATPQTWHATLTLYPVGAHLRHRMRESRVMSWNRSPQREHAA